MNIVRFFIYGYNIHIYINTYVIYIYIIIYTYVNTYSYIDYFKAYLTICFAYAETLAITIPTETAQATFQKLCWRKRRWRPKAAAWGAQM